MLVTSTFQPNNVILIRETYPSLSGQKEKKPFVQIDPDYYHSNFPSLPLGSGLDIDFEFQQPLNNSCPSPGYGSLPTPVRFTSRCKNTLMQSGGALEKEQIPSLFLTGTLPASTQDAYKTIASYTSYILNRIKTKFRQIQARRNCDSHWLSVWEYQKRGALHLHVCIASCDLDYLQELLLLWKIYWIKILEKVEQLSTTSLLSAPDGYRFSYHQIQAPAQLTKKSVNQYLAKYLSKEESKRINSAKSLMPSTFFAPGRWLSVSRSIKKLISRNTIKYHERVETIYNSTLFNHLVTKIPGIQVKEIKRPYSNRVSVRIVVPAGFYPALCSSFSSPPALAAEKEGVSYSSQLITGYRYILSNFSDFYHSATYNGIVLDGIYDLESFYRRMDKSTLKLMYIYAYWRSNPFCPIAVVRSYIHQNNLENLLTDFSDLL